MAEQAVVLAGQGDEGQAEHPRRRLDAEADIGHAAGDVGGHRGVGVFLVMEAVDPGAVDLRLLQQAFQEHARARALFAVDQAQAATLQVGQPGDGQAGAGGEDQALGAHDEGDHPVLVT
ncbi:hypothetical protein D3C80_1906700 [compost metagenome]